MPSWHRQPTTYLLFDVEGYARIISTSELNAMVNHIIHVEAPRDGEPFFDWIRGLVDVGRLPLNALLGGTEAGLYAGDLVNLHFRSPVRGQVHGERAFGGHDHRGRSGDEAPANRDMSTSGGG